MKNIFKSLSNFQKEVPVIHKGTKGYGYTYADLASIFKIINPLLEKHGLGFTQLIVGKSVKTILFHFKSAEVIESTTDIPQEVSLKGMNDFQVLGSAITYIRRYSLSSMLGIVTDKDQDGAGEQNKKQIKPWFNPDTENWKKALAKLATPEKIKEHYNISKDNENKYTQELELILEQS